MKPSEELIHGIRKGIQALRENFVEPMGLSITPHDGKFGWGLFKFKALPGHPNPGNAGNGWSHPAFKPNHELPISAPRDWPRGGSYPCDWETTLAEVKEFALEIGKLSGFGTDFELECAWSAGADMTTPGTKGILLDIVMLRGGAKHYDYYPDSPDEISYVDKDGNPVDPEKEEKVRTKFSSIKEQERKSTDRYMAPPTVENPVVIYGAWYVDTVPNGVVAELPDGKLVSFAVSPFRAVTPEEFDTYDGPHPRKLHGVPVPQTLYPYYGLAKSEESLSEVLRVRLAPSELEKIKAVADAAGKTVSEFVREWVRGL